MAKAFLIALGPPLLAAALLAVPADAEVIRRQEIEFEIEYDDGSREAGTVRYDLHFDPGCIQTMSNPENTSRVRLTVHGYIKREICVRSRAIGDACNAVWTKIFDRHWKGSREAYWDEVHELRPDTTCKKQGDRIREVAQPIKEAITSALPEIVKGDVPEALRLLQVPGVKKVRTKE